MYAPHIRPTVAVLAIASTVAALTITSSPAASRDHAATRRAMDTVVRERGIPGVLGQAEVEGETWHGAAGVADTASRRPRHPDDRFRIGSITKTFVATVVLQLAAEDKLGLDDPVERYLPGVVRGHGHDGREITLRQLLNHTSGVYDFTNDPTYRGRFLGAGFPAHRYDTHTPSDLVRVAMRHPPDFPPGADFAYSNTNYVLAGMVIEAVTGNTYAHEIRERLLRPLDLRQTSLPGTSPWIEGPNGRAYSTRRGERPNAPIHDVTALDPSLAGASGEMVSTTGDLIDFFRALLAGDVLPPRQLAQMTRTVPTGDASPGDGYGLGIRARRLSCGTTVWGHGGAIPGSRSVTAVTRDGAHAAAFNLNADWTNASEKLLEAEFCR